MDDARLDSLLEHADWVRGLAESLLLDQVEVDDVVQQTWLAAIERAPRPIAAPRGWLAAVVRNVALQMSRGERRRRRALPSVSLEGVGVEDRTAEQLDLHRRLVATVEALDEKDRALIVMRYFEGSTPQRMARELGLPVTTVRNRLSRALERLRSRLDREAGGRRTWSIALVGFLTASIAVNAGAAVPAGSAPSSVGGWVGGIARRLPVGRLAAAVLVVGAFLAVQQSISESPAEDLAIVGDREVGRIDAVPSRFPAPRVDDASTEALAVAAEDPGTPIRSLAAPPRLRGRVRDLHGAPIAGAEVRLIDERDRVAVAYDEIAKFERRARGSAAAATARTDLDGRFDVVAVRAGSYRVLVTASGYSLGVERTRPLAEGAVADLDFILGEVPRIRCVVVDEERRPLPGVNVTIHTPEGWVADHSLQLSEELVTAADGAFAFDLQQIQLTDVRDLVWDNLTAGRVRSRQAITLSTSGRVTRTIERFGGLPTDARGRLLLTMKRARDLTFTFVPPPGDEITEPLDFLVKMFTSRIIRRGRTDAAGRAVVRDLPETEVARFVVDSERWVVDYDADSWIGTAPSQAGLPVALPPSGDGHVVVRLGRGAVVRGRAVDCTGRPVPGIELRVSPYGGNLGARSHLRTATTAADGTFEVAGVQPGRIGIFCGSPTWAVAPDDDGRTTVDTGHRRGHRLEVQPGHVYDLVLEMVATAVVRGRVIDEHAEAIPGARVSLAEDSRALAGWPPLLHELLVGPTAICDAAGRFELGGLVPGLDVELLVRDSRHRPTRCEPLMLDEREILEGVRLVARAGAEVVVTVSDPAGDPVSDLDVMVAVGREYRFYARRDDALDRTDARGRAILRSLPRGPARVILGDVRRFGLILPHDFDADVVVPDGGELRIDVRLARPVTITGRVVDEDDAPVGGAIVVAVPLITDAHDERRLHSIVAERVEFRPENLRKAASFVASRRATTGADGRFTIVVDRERDYRLSCHQLEGDVTHRRSARGDDIATGGGDPVTLVVEPPSAPRVSRGRSRD